MDSAESKACESSYRLVVHAPCVNCRYDLYTLDPESRCPECGEPIRPSLNAFAAPKFGLNNDDYLIAVSYLNMIVTFMLSVLDIPNRLAIFELPIHAPHGFRCGMANYPPEITYPFLLLWPILFVVTLVRLRKPARSSFKGAAVFSLLFLVGVVITGYLGIR